MFPLLNDANWVKINEHELAILHQEASDLELALKGFCKKFDLDIIIVTLGEKGAIALDNQQFTTVKPTANIKVVDTVGASDAFTSVFLSILQATMGPRQLKEAKLVGAIMNCLY